MHISETIPQWCGSDVDDTIVNCVSLLSVSVGKEFCRERMIDLG